MSKPQPRSAGRGPGRKTHDRTFDYRFDLYPARLLGDSAYGSAEMLGWLVYEHGIEPHVTVFDKSTRQDGTFSRDDFTYDHVGDVYSCPAGKLLTTTGSRINDGAILRYRASKYDCQTCRLKSRCCPKEPARYVPRSIYEGARDMARQIASSWQGHTADDCARKLKCCSPISNAFSSSIGSNLEDRMARAMSPFSQRPPKTSESWRS